jgi:NADPH:quinone reductase-like Zn-dependent oxidoreductase
MRAYVLSEPGKGVGAWKMAEKPDPKPGPGEVLIRVRAASLNFRDLMVARGMYGRSIAKKDLVPLSDGAGEVVEAGDGVTALKPGDRVAANFFQGWFTGPRGKAGFNSDLGAGENDGMLAGLVALRPGGLVRIPAHLSLEEASTLPCAAVTAWNALFETPGPLRPGASVLTMGSGGVSVFALQFAKAAGLKVIATSSSETKMNRLRELGADATVNYRANEEWDAEVKRLTGGDGVDQVIEVGGNTLPRSLRAVRYGGRVSLIGGLGGWDTEVSLMSMFAAGATLQPIMVGSVAMFEAMNRSIEASGIRPVIDEVFPFEKANEALAKLESGSHFGKIVIAV